MQRRWGFYGRTSEVADIGKILDRGRWFFCAISGRRRIGKTRLVQEALKARDRRVLYVQIPDSDERGVIQALQDALESLEMPPEIVPAFRTFADMAAMVRALCHFGWIVIIDEFQYFHRKALSPFTSYLQAAVDQLRDTDKGGLIVLGSIHTEMMAVLEDQSAPLFNRITDRIEVRHWDFETLFEMFNAHDITEPAQQLFLWSLFEGVPKFYRDCFEQGVLAPSEDYRHETLRRLFFEGSSPLKDEADNWFLREFRGRYDTVLRLLARLGSCSHGDLNAEFKRAGSESERQLGGYLKILVENYRMVERQMPIFAGNRDRKGRYVITDNFLMSWLGAIAKNISAARFKPLADALSATGDALATVEGFAFEKMVRQLTEEASRKGVGDFALTDFVRGYWNAADIEIDLVAVNEDDRIIRFGSCKRSADKHDTTVFDGHVDRFLKARDGKRFAGWIVQKALYSPIFAPDQRKALESQGYVCLDIPDFRNVLYRKKA